MTETKMTGREILIAAMEQYDITYCDEFPPIEADLLFDEECEKNLRKLIRRLNNPFRNYFNTVGKRAAGIAAAILVFFGCSMSVSAVRKPVVEFFTNAYEKLVEFFFDDESVANAPSTIETVYTLGYVPEGYELMSSDLSKYQNRIIWERDSNECIIFIQSTLDGVVSYDNEESKYELIETNNFSVVFVKKHDLLMLFWSDNQYKYSLDVYGGLTLDECVALIESIHELTD